MGERSLAQVAHDAYWRATSSVVTPWDEVQGMFKGAWTAVATACAQQEREATETQRFLATKFERRCTELEATIESGRSMNAVLRTQLAEATDEAATLRLQLADVSERLRTVEEQALGYEAERDAALRELDEHEDVETLRNRLAKMSELLDKAQAEASSWAQACGKAQTEARELREGRATWVTDDKGIRRLMVRRVVEAEAGGVWTEGPAAGPEVHCIARVHWSVDHEGAFAEGTISDDERDFEQAMCRAQRIVEAVAGVRP